METHVASPRSATRMFVVYALISLIPVALLGLALAGSYRQSAAARGLSESRAKAALLARTAVVPLISRANLSDGLSPHQNAALDRMSAEAIASGQFMRLQIRDLAGDVIFSTDPSLADRAPDDEAVEAAHGETVSRITHLDADNNPNGPQGAKVAEVYQPLLAGNPAHQLGVLEVYLPYAPIAADVDAGVGALYRDLGLGLFLLAVLLAGISHSATRRFRAQLARNAFLAQHDVLTGLPNRALFQQRVVEALARATRGGPGVTVAVIDLDRFKEVNDTLGHANGDALLCELGHRLAQAVGGGDTIARLGGDEFGLVLTECGNEDDVLTALHLLRRILQQEIEVSGLPISADASIGFAMWPEDGQTVDSLLQHADVAMYVAKAAYSGVVRYDEAHDHYDSGKLSLVAELKRAISANELVLHYQPKASVASGQILAVEALVRWRHPERGLLYPDAFLPIAEQTDIIEPLTEWVLVSALHQLSLWSADFDDLAVAINVSARNICRGDFAQTVLRAIRGSGVRPERLLLEITETAFVTDPERAGRSLRQLAAAGVRISLDDFGCGQTSLGYLSTLPLHEVKIDKSFVMDMLDDHSHAAIVRSVIDLAHNLGFEVVAEGVETDRVLAELTVLGCDIAQGYLLAKPMPAQDLAGWITAQEAPVAISPVA
ncbi:MAG TPA: bifunctional diguanylate cyclase/phosphodiesterase [Mycobacteriales bacterium]|nr:bifunctional diguanylate cyclase/phosphodiesterase [Mycobacteriales bacterium]